MMSRPRSLLVSALLPLILWPSLIAGQTAGEEEVVRFRFEVVALDNFIRGLFFASGGEETPVFVTNGSFSRTYEFASAQDLTFYRKQSNEDGTVVRQPVAQLNVDSSLNGGFYRILFRKASGEAERYELFPVNFSEHASRGDRLFLVNLCADPIAVALGGKRVQVPGQQTRMLDVQPDANGYLETLVLRRRDAAFEAEAKKNLQVGNGNHTVLFIYPDAENPDWVHVKTLIDAPAEPGDGAEEATSR